MSNCSIINKLTVLDKDGNPKQVENRPDSHIEGIVSLVGGSGIAVTDDEASKEIILAVDSSGTADDPVYRQKWVDIINGNGPYSGVPYYTSKINNVEPLPDNTFFLVGGLCSQLGLFNDSGDPILIPSSTTATLEWYDMCEACLDCGDYEKLFEYTERIEEWLDQNKDNNLVDDIQLFKQYQATVHYWNYLVHAQSIILKVYASGSDVRVKTGYRCLDCGPFQDVYIQLSVTQVGGNPTTGTWSVQGRDLSPPTLTVGAFEADPEATSESSDAFSNASFLIYIESIDKNEYAILDLLYEVSNDDGTSSESSGTQSDGDESSSSSLGLPHADQNTFQITATWFDTHLGETVSRSKAITVAAP